MSNTEQESSMCTSKTAGEWSADYNGSESITILHGGKNYPIMVMWTGASESLWIFKAEMEYIAGQNPDLDAILNWIEG